MKTKNFKLVQAIFESGLRHYEIIEQTRLSSEARLSRIINGRVEPTEEEITGLVNILGKTSRQLGFGRGIK